MDLVVGSTTELGDNASQLYCNVEYMATDNSLFFINGTYNNGGKGKRFGSTIESQITFGLEYYF